MESSSALTSTKNPRIKNLLALQQKSAERRRAGLFVVEGRRELEHCLEAGYEVVELYVCPELLPTDVRFPDADILVVSPAVYERIAYRGTTEGVVAVVRTRHLTLSDLQLSVNPLIVVLESVEKPGNLGAILRSADAAGADAVVVCDPLTDLYNPNLIRASIGAIFTVPTVACSSAECIGYLKERDIQILTAQLQDSHPYYDTDMRQPTAIVMGTESTGLTDQWRQAATAHIRIPMLGHLDSLNVSVSSAILLYEAVRQREG
ncbi:MAG: RNA methyltransferase [Bacteroidaceae bacterium]|nr:RNA methyltransferase [Bacteroidaceae bacterium]